MTPAAETPAGHARTPVQFWIVGVVSLLWNSFGAFDYSMSHLKGEAYYRAAGMSEAQIALMATYPSWMHAVWAIGVWGSFAGAILLLLRSRWSVAAFSISLLGVIGNLAYTAMTPAVAQAMGVAMPLLILAICLLLLGYARAMANRGVLR